MIEPILALIAWTFVVWLWMFATRIPAMQKAQVDPAELSRTGAKMELPPEITRIGDNYNHLHEQPTLFYALAVTAHIAGAVDPVNVGLAWGYVGLRVVHSLVQGTVNHIPLRFGIFILGSIVLFALLVRTILAL